MEKRFGGRTVNNTEMERDEQRLEIQVDAQNPSNNGTLKIHECFFLSQVAINEALSCCC